jgi:hypothetical protein
MPTTVTIRATAAFLNPFTDLRRPSALDIVVTNSNDPNIPNGLYDAWCLDPFTPFYVRTNYSANAYDAQDDAGYQAVNLGALTATQIAQINWLVAQNFAWDQMVQDRINSNLGVSLGMNAANFDQLMAGKQNRWSLQMARSRAAQSLRLALLSKLG